MMLQRQPEIFVHVNIHSFIREERAHEFFAALECSRSPGRGSGPDACFSSAGENPTSEEEQPGLEDAARTERDYLRQRLRKELGHEPTEQELDEWLRQHTEGY
jgi:hypothetical protein